MSETPPIDAKDFDQREPFDQAADEVIEKIKGKQWTLNPQGILETQRDPDNRHLQVRMDWNRDTILKRHAGDDALILASRNTSDFYFNRNGTIDIFRARVITPIFDGWLIDLGDILPQLRFKQRSHDEYQVHIVDWSEFIRGIMFSPYFDFDVGWIGIENSDRALIYNPDSGPVGSTFLGNLPHTKVEYLNGSAGVIRMYPFRLFNNYPPYEGRKLSVEESKRAHLAYTSLGRWTDTGSLDNDKLRFPVGDKLVTGKDGKRIGIPVYEDLEFGREYPIGLEDEYRLVAEEIDQNGGLRLTMTDTRSGKLAILTAPGDIDSVSLFNNFWMEGDAWRNLVRGFPVNLQFATPLPRR